MTQLINKTRLNFHTQKLWEKIKTDLTNGTIINAQLSDDKTKIVFTKRDDTVVEVLMTDFTTLTAANTFTEANTFKDVLINEGFTLGTADFGTGTSGYNSSTAMGTRTISTQLFAGGFVNKIIIYGTSATTAPINGVFVYPVTKGATRAADRVGEPIINHATYQVQTEGGKRYFEIPINRAFEADTYFIFKANPNNLQSITNISGMGSDSIINTTNEITPGQAPADNTGGDGWILNFSVVGKISVKSMIDSLLTLPTSYVAKTDLTTTGGSESGNKVPQLDSTGKLNANMLPSISINEYFSVTTFDETSLNAITYENGDVVVETSTGDRYLCVDHRHETVTQRFIKLNDKSGSVVHVNGQTGAVTLSVQSTVEKVSLMVNDAEVSFISTITEDDITNMINDLN